jgi:hypothetical protein
MGDTVREAKPEFLRAMDRIESEIREGMGHGFFELFVTCVVIKDGKRRLTIRAGKSYRFVIPEEEVSVSKIA